MPGHGADPGSSISKVVHAQKVEPMTISELNKFITTADSQVHYPFLYLQVASFKLMKHVELILVIELHLQHLTDNRVSLHR